jgi:hypothetical protein
VWWTSPAGFGTYLASVVTMESVGRREIAGPFDKALRAQLVGEDVPVMPREEPLGGFLDTRVAVKRLVETIIGKRGISIMTRAGKRGILAQPCN